MTPEIAIPAYEHGIIRVFSIELPDDQIDAFAKDDSAAKQPLLDALGIDTLDPEFIDVFPVSKVEALGLSGYLTSGLGVLEGDVAMDQKKLDDLTGHVLIVTSSAFGERAVTLTPNSPLRLIGTYREEASAAHDIMDPADVAPITATPDTGTADAPPANPGSLVLVLAVAILVVLILAVVIF